MRFAMRFARAAHSSRRSPRAAPPQRGSPSSSSSRARCSRTSAPRGRPRRRVLRALGPRGRAGSRRLHPAGRSVRGRDRGDRGIRRDGPSLPRARRHDSTDRGAFRPARARLRLPLLRRTHPAERGRRARGKRRGGPDPGPGADGGNRDHARATRSRRGPRALLGAGQAHRGSRRGPRPERRADRRASLRDPPQGGGLGRRRAGREPAHRHHEGGRVPVAPLRRGQPLRLQPSTEAWREARARCRRCRSGHRLPRAPVRGPARVRARVRARTGRSRRRNRRTTIHRSRVGRTFGAGAVGAGAVRVFVIVIVGALLASRAPLRGSPRTPG